MMILFPASNQIEIFVNGNNQISIREYDHYLDEAKIIVLNKGQFSELLACGNSLLVQIRDSEMEREKCPTE